MSGISHTFSLTIFTLTLPINPDVLEVPFYISIFYPTLWIINILSRQAGFKLICLGLHGLCSVTTQTRSSITHLEADFPPFPVLVTWIIVQEKWSTEEEQPSYIDFLYQLYKANIICVAIFVSCFWKYGTLQ